MGVLCRGRGRWRGVGDGHEVERGGGGDGGGGWRRAGVERAESAAMDLRKEAK